MNKRKIKTDFLIVGAGFYGSILAERIANVLKKNVLIIDKRNHFGGNCYSEIDDKTGILYHKYGTHIFHTSNKRVWNYIKNFTEFNSYRHQVLSVYKNKIYQMPINLETINSFFNKNFRPKDAEKFLKQITKKHTKKSYNNFEDKALCQIGEKLYKAFVKNYTIKQWNQNPRKLPASIFNRLPIRFNYNEDYFNRCNWQGMPIDGYTEIFRRILSNKRIKFVKNNFYKLNDDYDVKYLTIFTGPLDKLFNNKFGELKWRSLKFIKEIKNIGDYQGTSVVNYPELNYKYTRIHEPRHLHKERNYKNNKTLIMKEYPILNSTEPYYPVNDNENRDLHRKYIKMAEKIPKFEFGGRLSDYAYYDMDMTMSAALKKFDKILKNFS